MGSPVCSLRCPMPRSFLLWAPPPLPCLWGPRYINPEIPREMCSGIELRIYSQRLWVYTMIIEHGVMLMRVVIGSLSPENPEWIEYDKDTLNYRVEQWENGMEDMQREGCSLEQIHDAMNSVYANKLKAIQEKKTFM